MKENSNEKRKKIIIEIAVSIIIVVVLILIVNNIMLSKRRTYDSEYKMQSDIEGVYVNGDDQIKITKDIVVYSNSNEEIYITWVPKRGVIQADSRIIVRKNGDLQVEGKLYSRDFMLSVKENNNSRSGDLTNNDFNNKEQDYINKCQAEDCYKNGTNKIMGLNGEYEYYCDEHYKIILETMDMIENDTTKNKCKVDGCNNTGNHKIEGFNGEYEYYCDKHYNEIIGIMSDIENDMHDNKHSCIVNGCNKSATKSVEGINGPVYYCDKHYSEFFGN